MSASKSLPSLRRHLLLWFLGCAAVMVFAYTMLLDYYLALGIDLRTQSFLERTAVQYAADRSAQPELPADQNLQAYLQLSDIPPPVRERFSRHRFIHGEVQRFVNLDLDDDEPDGRRYRIDTVDLCGAQTCELIFFYPYQLPNGNWLYLLQGLVGSDEDFEELEITEAVANAIAGLFALVFLVVGVMVVRDIHRPLRVLEEWSSSGGSGLDAGQADIPDLRFHEFDTLAQRLHRAFQQMREGVVREKLFLRHASHELRTPIAILSSNVELMDRLTNTRDRSSEEDAAFERQYRALADVQLLIETLLWINRQSDQVPKSEPVNLRTELDGVIDSYRYLLDENPVTLSVQGEASMVTAPRAAIQMVLSNLVRNAFQYTAEGEVLIRVEAMQVTFANPTDTAPNEMLDSDDYGFGLGLELVDLLCQRFGWRYENVEHAAVRQTTVTFSG